MNTAADRLYEEIVRDEAARMSGGVARARPGGFYTHHPLPLPILNTARPDRADAGFVAEVSEAHGRVHSRFSLREPLAIAGLLEAAGYHPAFRTELLLAPAALALEQAAGVQTGLALTREDVRSWLLCREAAPWPPGTDPAQLLEGPHRLALARRDGLVVGAAALWVDRSRSAGILWGGYTAPGARGSGVYRALLSIRLQAARALGLRVLLTQAAGAAPILLRWGFEKTSVFRDSWERSPRSVG